jgi:hypothetical protein
MVVMVCGDLVGIFGDIWRVRAARARTGSKTTVVKPEVKPEVTTGSTDRQLK